MYARLRQKITWTDSAATANSPSSNSLGNNATTLLVKDIARIATGYISTVNDLNPNIWDIPNCEVVRTVNPGWNEYQNNFVNTNTNFNITTSASSASQANGMIYLRTTNAANTSSGGSIYKYLALSFVAAQATSSRNYSWNVFNAWRTSDFVGNPVLDFYCNAEAPTNLGLSASFGRQPFTTDVFMEYIIYCSPRAFFISGQTIGFATASKVSMFLEYPSTAQSQVYNLPNQIWYETTSIRSVNTAGSNYQTQAYNITGGYNPAVGTDILTGQQGGSSTNNANFAIVYANDPTIGGRGYQSLYSTGSASTDLSTFKPANNATMAVTVDSAGNSLTIPVMPLLHWPAWDSVYDCSSLTGIYGTKSGLGSSGDTLFINGVPYAYVNVTNMGYLIPRQ